MFEEIKYCRIKKKNTQRKPTLSANKIKEVLHGFQLTHYQLLLVALATTLSVQALTLDSC